MANKSLFCSRKIMALWFLNRSGFSSSIVKYFEPDVAVFLCSLVSNLFVMLPLFCFQIVPFFSAKSATWVSPPRGRLFAAPLRHAIHVLPKQSKTVRFVLVRPPRPCPLPIYFCWIWAQWSLSPLWRCFLKLLWRFRQKRAQEMRAGKGRRDMCRYRIRLRVRFEMLQRLPSFFSFLFCSNG